LSTPCLLKRDAKGTACTLSRFVMRFPWVKETVRVLSSWCRFSDVATKMLACYFVDHETWAQFNQAV